MQKEGRANIRAFDELKAAQEQDIAACTDQIDAKTQENADGDEKLAQNKEDLEDTKKTLASDEEFLAMLKEKCPTTDAEWEERTKTRQLEMEACSASRRHRSTKQSFDQLWKPWSAA